MRNVYAQAGKSIQQIGGDCPDGWVVMQGDRPTPTHVAAADGTWIPAPAIIPQIVSRAQGKAALIQAGLWAGVLAYVDGITDAIQKALAEVALNDTTEWRRDSPFLNTAATALGLSGTDLDNLFVAGSQIHL